MQSKKELQKKAAKTLHDLAPRELFRAYTRTVARVVQKKLPESAVKEFDEVIKKQQWAVINAQTRSYAKRIEWLTLHAESLDKDCLYLFYQLVAAYQLEADYFQSLVKKFPVLARETYVQACLAVDFTKTQKELHEHAKHLELDLDHHELGDNSFEQKFLEEAGFI